MQGVILAAGKGSRLQPITLKRSKAMLPILGKPMVERVMEMMGRNGVDDFIVVVSPDDRDIIRYFHRESQLEGDVRFVFQSERLGMANALTCAAPLITSDFILSACDNLVLEEDMARLIAMWQTLSPLNGLLTLMPVEQERLGSVGLVEMEGPFVKRIIEKPKPEEAPSNISSLPLYCFSPRILSYLPEVPRSPRGEYEIQDAIQMLIDRDGEVRGMTITGRLTVTNAADLLALNRRYLTQGDGRPQLAPYTVGPGTRLITPLRIEEGAMIGENCTIGPNVYIERDCHIGNNVTLCNTILLREVVVADGARIEDQVIC